MAANKSVDNTVMFDASLVGSTITLTSGEIVVSRQLTIAGPGAAQLTISGNDASRIFHVVQSGLQPAGIEPHVTRSWHRCLREYGI